MLKEKEMENRMEEALDNNEFVVYLQPKVNLKNNNIVGAEALVRWQDPDRGLIPPNDFIPFLKKMASSSNLTIMCLKNRVP